MDIIQVIKNRRSVRRYQSTPVKREDIITILEAAHCAPSAMNRRPWEFLVVTGETILKMGELLYPIIERFAANWNPSYAKSSISREEFIEFSKNYGSTPVIIVITVETQKLPNFQKAYIESASAAMENLLLAASALGLGTCWMTGPLEDERSLKILLGIPETKEIVAITPLGYPIKNPELRLPPEDTSDLLSKIRWIE